MRCDKTRSQKSIKFRRKRRRSFSSVDVVHASIFAKCHQQYVFIANIWNNKRFAIFFCCCLSIKPSSSQWSNEILETAHSREKETFDFNRAQKRFCNTKCFEFDAKRRWLVHIGAIGVRRSWVSEKKSKITAHDRDTAMMPRGTNIRSKF